MAAWRAGAAERARALSWIESAALLDCVRREGDRQVLLALHRAATGLELWAPGRVRDASLMAPIEARVANGELLLLRDGGVAPGGTSSQSAEQALIEAVMQGRRTVTFQGQRYVFALAERWSGRDGVPEYIAMHAEAARDLAAGMEAAMARMPEEHVAWQNLAAALADRRSGAAFCCCDTGQPSATRSPAWPPSR